MPSYVMSSLIALFFLASSSIFLKFTAKHRVKNSLVFYYYYLLVYFLLGLVIPVIKPIQFVPADLNSLKPVIFGSTTAFLGGFFFFASLYKLDLTTINPLRNFRTIFSAVLALIFLGETISLKQLPWFTVIFISGFFVSIDERIKPQNLFRLSTLGFLIYVFSTSLYSIFTNLGVASVGYWNFLYYSFVYSFILPAVCLTPVVYKSLHITGEQFKSIFFSTLFELVGIIFLAKAFSENVIISTLILSFPSVSIFTWMISRLKPELLEHHTGKVYLIRFIGIFSMFVSTIALVLSL